MADGQHDHPPVEPAQQAVPVDISVRSAALTMLAAVAVTYALRWAQEVFIPIVLGILISYALAPMVKTLTRLRLPRAAAAAIVVAGVAGAMGATAYSLTDDALAVVAQLPEAAQKFRQIMQRSRDGEGPLEDVQQAATELQRTADETAGRNPASRGVQRVQVEEPAIDVREYLTWGSAGLVAFAGQATLVGFFVFFLLASDDLFKRKLVKMAGPSLEKKKITVKILDDINVQIERFLFVRVVTSIVVAVASWGAFRFVGLEQAGMWAIAAGVFNSVPYFGPVIVACGTAVVAFLQFETIGMAAYVAALSLGITSVEGWLLTPWLTSRAARTNEIAIFIALIFWSFVWGIWGTLLAVPMLVTFKAYCDRIEELQPLGEMLGK